MFFIRFFFLSLFFVLPLCGNDKLIFFRHAVDLIPSSLDEEKNQEIESNKQKIINQVLYAKPFVQGYRYVINWYEWQELAISDYITLFDRTHTIFGRWGLEQLTKPIDNVHVIKQRQESVAKIDQDEQLFNKLCKLLDEIKQVEDSFLAYFDEHDQLNAQAQQLYYSYFTSILNNSKVALDYAYVADSCNAVTNLASLLCINGLMCELIDAQLERRSIDFIQGSKNGFMRLLHDHSFNDDAYQQLKAGKKFALAPLQIEQATISETGGIYSWLNDKILSFSNHMKKSIHRVKETVKNTAVMRTVLQGSFGDRWSFFKEQCNWASPIAFLWVVGQVAYQDHRLWLSIKQNYERLTFLYKTHVSLQHRLCDVANFFSKIKELQEIIQDIPALQNHCGLQKLDLLLNEKTATASIQKILHLLQASTFVEKQHIFYSRGHVLITHKLMQELKDELLPVMQAVGVIDGFVSICRVYHEYKDHQERPFCFAQMSVSKKPMLDIVDGWLPLIRSNHIGNSISLGGDDQSRNLLLTGPNGGGKSSLLKLMGGSVVLAHSWGIVPANACNMSLFAGLRTSFNPQEDIAHDISTFMAQKKRLGQLQQYVQQSDKDTCHLLLVDEPYRGTIEAEAEKRAYQFGDYIAQYQQIMLVMASHLQQPIHLQENTGLFINKQMQITSNDDGTFNRTFKLLDGAAWWWFVDIEKRMQFIDWLHADL
ncbi:MAG: hypothetical protein WD055_01565 [Candidatus Dependentiae bacterium]